MNKTFRGHIGDISFIDAEGIALPIFFQGCKRRCKGCHNPELWDFEGGEEIEIDNLVKYLIDHRDWYDSVAIMGGEPLEQKEALGKLLRDIKKQVPDLSIWLYTGYEFEEIPLDILIFCDVVKCGPYIEELKTGGFPASSNQRIINLRSTSRRQKNRDASQYDL